MTLKDIANLLRTVGIPVVYRKFKSKKDMPYICYLVSYSNNFVADGKVFQKFSHIQIELYTEGKDIEMEEKVENALTDYVWEKTETYLDTERCYQILYEIEV